MKVGFGCLLLSNLKYSLSLYFNLAKNSLVIQGLEDILTSFLESLLQRYMYLANRIDLVIDKIKLAISVQITTVNRREIKVKYFINKSFLTEMRMVMFVIVKEGIIYFKIFNYQKLWEMVRYCGD